ncbi:hypothetical protein ACJW31_11G174500 [Castanea mollissima]
MYHLDMFRISDADAVKVLGYTSIIKGKMYRLDTSRILDDGVRKKLKDLLSQSFHRSRWLCCLEDWPKIAHLLNFSNAEWLGEGLTYCFWKDQYTPTLLGVFFNPKSYWGTRHGQSKNWSHPRVRRG